jgi:hypothetical protein
MTDYNKIKADAELKEKYNNHMKEYLKNKYHTDPVYREYMQTKARKRKAMLREQKTK